MISKSYCTWSFILRFLKYHDLNGSSQTCEITKLIMMKCLVKFYNSIYMAADACAVDSAASDVLFCISAYCNLLRIILELFMKM